MKGITMFRSKSEKILVPRKLGFVIFIFYQSTLAFFERALESDTNDLSF